MMHSQDLQKLEGVLSPSHLELLEDSLEELLEKTGVFLSDSEKTEGETKVGGHGWKQEKINRWWKTRSLNQKVKKDEAVSATTKIVCPEANTESAAPQAN